MIHSVWIRELRVPFLLLPVVCVPVGTAIALYHGSFNPIVALLTLTGVLCLHGSVNVLNDYFDYRSGIDIITIPTPFSGGSRILPDKRLTPKRVLVEGLVLLAGGLCIGAYFVVSFAYDPILISILAFAALSTVAYSPLISKHGLGEAAAGVGLGLLVVLGSYYVQVRRIISSP